MHYDMQLSIEIAMKRRELQMLHANIIEERVSYKRELDICVLGAIAFISIIIINFIFLCLST